MSEVIKAQNDTLESKNLLLLREVENLNNLLDGKNEELKQIRRDNVDQ
jgi:hypothetical protein